MLELPHFSPGKYVEQAVTWMQDHWKPLFDELTQFVTFLVDKVLFVLTSPQWWVMALVFTALIVGVQLWRGTVRAAVGLGIYTVLAMCLIQMMGLWVDAMMTVALVVVAGVISALFALPLGILAAKSNAVSSLLRPVLDFMQTLPVFVYLIPAVALFQIGVTPGVMATIVFSMPPAVRLTELGIRNVDAEAVEAGHAFGAKGGQILRGTQIPLAMPSIMAGINQLIMLALSMTVVAALVGAEGLGSPVISGIQNLELATGVNGGIAVVLIAVYLDRLTGAFGAARRRTEKNTDQDRNQEETVEANKPRVAVGG